jgi:hypothetical protein
LCTRIDNNCPKATQARRKGGGCFKSKGRAVVVRPKEVKRWRNSRGTQKARVI